MAQSLRGSPRPERFLSLFRRLPRGMRAGDVAVDVALAETVLVEPADASPPA